MKSETFVVGYCVLLAFTFLCNHCCCFIDSMLALLGKISPSSKTCCKIMFFCTRTRTGFWRRAIKSFWERRMWIQRNSGFTGCKCRSQWFLVSWFLIHVAFYQKKFYLHTTTSLRRKPVVKLCFFVQGLIQVFEERQSNLSKNGKHGFNETVVSQDVNAGHSGF